jgi:HD superfamily phosphodiesterase
VHDIVDYKYCSPKLAGQPTLEQKQARLETFLMSIPELADGWVPRIINWINNMSFSKEKKNGLPDMSETDMLYRNILSDADKWEALGPIGIRRCREYHIMLNPEIDHETVEQEILDHIEEKIIILYQYCRTPLGRAHAIELTKPIREFYAKTKAKKGN